MRKVLLWVLGVVVLVVVLATGVLMWFGIPGKAATMAAKTVCSAAFVAGRPSTNDLKAQDVLPASGVLRVVTVDIDEENHSVTAKFLGIVGRTASLVTDRGCVAGLPPDPTATPFQPTSDPAPWPQGDAPVDSAQWGSEVDGTALLAAVGDAMQGAGDPDGANPRGIAVAQGGRLLVAQEPTGFDNGTGLHGWSMAKTVTGMLFYKLAAERGLSLDTRVVDAFPAEREPTWVAQWRADSRQDITLNHLMRMLDGLDNTEEYAITGNVPQMLYAEPDMSGWAADHPAEVPAGSRFRYLSATTNILSAVARAQFATDAEYWSYPRAALYGPIGARSAAMETDTAGTWVGASYGWASITDWARLGQLLLNEGTWDGRAVLPPGFMATATRPSLPDGEGRAYGATLWLLGDPVAGECKDYPDVPADTVAMEGHWGQLVAVVPSKDAVVARMGWTVADDGFDVCAFLSGVLATLPDQAAASS